MLAQTITYEDFNGHKRTEVFHFNLTETEIAEMDMNESQMAKDGSIIGGLEDKLTTIRESGVGREILAAFKDILFMSFGIKSEDGRRFKKSAEISREFEESPAYDVLFRDITGDEKFAANFINAVVPAKLSGRDADKPSGIPMGQTQTIIETKAPEAPQPKDDLSGYSSGVTVVSDHRDDRTELTPEEIERFRKAKEAGQI